MIHISFDIDMPASCEKCPFLIHCDECEGWENFCALLHKRNGYDYISFADYELTPTDRRREDCPLKDGDGRPHGAWEYLKEHITEMRDADGKLNQKETCQFILNLMGVIEKEGEAE